LFQAAGQEILRGTRLDPEKQNDWERSGTPRAQRNPREMPISGQDSSLNYWHWRYRVCLVTSRHSASPAIPEAQIVMYRKTATLLEIAHQEADRRNIFFVHAHDAASLHQAYYHIAKTIGPEYLLKEYRGQDIQQIWSNESPEDKVGRFKVWLKDPENEDSLFLLDDMDGIQLLEHREAAFPDEAKTILYTTRNPVYHKDNIRSRHKVRLSAMDEEVCRVLTEREMELILS
jgi:hypothetical protein